MGKNWLLAGRALLRRPAYALTVFLVLGLGIGATATLFSVLDTVLLQPLPYPHADRLVTVLEANPAKRQNDSLVAPARLVDWNRRNQTFVADDGISGYYGENNTDTSGSEPERVACLRVAPGFFSVFGMPPLVGRTFNANEETSTGPGAAVISYGFWTRRYGRSPDALNRALVLNGTRFAIVGVMPRNFTDSALDAWLPARTPPFLLTMREARFFTGMGRLRPGVTIAQAQADLARVEAQLGRQYPATDAGWSANVTDMKSEMVGASSTTLWAVFAAVMLLLLLAIANIAGLTLAQLQSRERELAIRSALGGSRRQVVATVMREVGVLAGAGATFGGVLAWAGVRAIAGLAPGTIPRMAELHFDPRGWLFAVVISAAAAIGFGLGPALAVTRTRLAEHLASLNAGAPGGRRWLQRGLVVSQLALTVLLLAGAGLLLRSYYNLNHVRAGFDATHVVTFHVGAGWDEDRGKIAAMQITLLHKLDAQPGVEAAGFTNFLVASNATLQFQMKLAGMAGSGASGTYNVGERSMTSGYLQALHVPLMAGTWCPEPSTNMNAAAPAMVNQAFVDTYLHGEGVVGREFTIGGAPSAPARIVGVVGNVRENSLAVPATPFLYYCIPAGGWPDPEYVVRTAGDPAPLMGALRGLVEQVAPGRAVFGLERLQTVVDASLEQPELEANFLALFAGFALLLAAVGLYSLISLLVAARRREMGVRMAMGARPGQVAGLVLASTGRLLLCGALTGLVLTWAADRLLATLLYGVTPLDPLTLAAACGLLAAVAALATWLPARRAAGLDPVDALRPE